MIEDYLDDESLRRHEQSSEEEFQEDDANEDGRIMTRAERRRIRKDRKIAERQRIRMGGNGEVSRERRESVMTRQRSQPGTRMRTRTRSMLELEESKLINKLSS